MEFFKRTTNINFLATRKPALIMSIVVLIMAIASLSTRGLNFGIDFTGGIVIELAYPAAADLNQVRETLGTAGFDDAIAQQYGTPQDILVRLQPREGKSNADISNKVLEALQAVTPGVELRRVEFVGPQVGAELAEKGAVAMLLTLLGILIYIVFRFEWRLAVGAVAATLHDIVFTVGWFSVFRIEFDLTVLAAVLAVIGYSLNDTVVVFDRIRENFRRMRRSEPIDVMNAAINQTLSRTIITSGVTMLVVLALFFVGGTVMHGFALALIVGIAVGTYSSIYIASATALMLGLHRGDLMVQTKEGEDDGRP